MFMEIKELYRYEREPGKITVSPIKPECEYTIMYRIIASEGYEITLDGINKYSSIDANTNEGWYEVEMLIEEESEE